jgi:hypothetical protein
MQIPNVLDEHSPYRQDSLVYPDTWWYVRWGTLVEWLREYEAGGNPPGLPMEMRRPGALRGLAIGLMVRQAALATEFIKTPISWRQDHSEWAAV